MENPVIILGAGSLGKAASEIFKSNGISVYCFLDDDKSLLGKEINEISVLGRTDDEGILKHIGKKCESFVAEDENTVRRSLVKMLNEKRKVMPVNAIHRNAVLSSNASIGHGNLINAGAQLGSFVNMGNHCIIYSGAIIDHDVSLGDFVQVGAGSIINSGVNINDEVFVGSGVTIVSGIKVGKGARIGAGSVVVADVGSGQTLFGNPAKPID